MTTASKKAKGRNLQKLVVDKIKVKFTQLVDNDVKSTSMGVTGEDIQLSPHGEKILGPLYIECKNVEKLNVLSVMEETRLKAQAKKKIPIVVHKRNGIKPVVILDLDTWLELLYWANGLAK